MESLIKTILDGNTDGFRKIIQKYEKQLLGTAYHFTHDWDQAKDITQNTFITIYKNLSKFDSTKRFEPWLYKIHLNQCRSEYRKNKIRNQFMKMLMLDSQNSIDHYEVNLDVVRLCIDRLSWKQKTAFILMNIEGYSSKEAAERMDCSDATVRVHLNRAKINIQKKLRKLGYEK